MACPDRSNAKASSTQCGLMYYWFLTNWYEPSISSEFFVSEFLGTTNKCDHFYNLENERKYGTEIKMRQLDFYKKNLETASWRVRFDYYNDIKDGVSNALWTTDKYLWVKYKIKNYFSEKDIFKVKRDV